MASCDDDFAPLYGDDHHSHHHQSNPSHHHISTTANTSHHHRPNPYATRFVSKSVPIQAPSPPPSASQQIISTSAVTGDPKRFVGHGEDNGDDYSDCAPAFPDVVPFSADDGSIPFENSEPDQDRARIEKRKDRDEVSDGGTPYSYKRVSSKVSSGAGTSCGGEYRKDREEWSEAAISCLLESYTVKCAQLSRGNLRGRDWEDVASTVREQCEKQSKSVEQCKNKVDNLKKRYKLEIHRMSNAGITVSHWPWFKKMEEIVGKPVPVKVVPDEDKAIGMSTPSNVSRQSKRYALPTSSNAGPLANVKPKSVPTPKWRRVVFKISGTALSGAGPNNIDPKVAMLIAREVAIACRLGVQVAIVVGGRNFFCGESWVSATGLDRPTAYQIGMMATVMNSVLLYSALEKMGIPTRVQTTFAMQEVVEPYSWQRAIRHLEKGKVVIFGGIGSGTGNPLFSTDTAAALRASEIHAEAVLKGTNVDGVYDCNSRNNNPTIQHLSFRDLVSRGSTPMDMMAMTFCEENSIPVVVFNLLEPGNISRALCGEKVGTLIDKTRGIC